MQESAKIVISIILSFFWKNSNFVNNLKKLWTELEKKQCSLLSMYSLNDSGTTDYSASWRRNIALKIL